MDGNVTHIGGEDSDVDDSADEPESVIVEPEPSRPPTKKERVWKDVRLSPIGRDWTPSIVVDFSEKTPTDLYNLFFDENVMQYIVDQMILYAHQEKLDYRFHTDVTELHVFFSILLVSGYSTVSRKRMYWETNPDCHNAAIANSMSRNRFDEMLKYFHLADNEKLPENDRDGKVRALYSMMNEKCLAFFQKQRDLSVDESMIPYYGRHSSKQRMQGKPI